MSNLGNTGYKVVDIYIVPINYSQTIICSIGILLKACIYTKNPNAKCWQKTKYFVGGGGWNCKSFVGRDGGRPFPRLFPKAILSHSPATVSPHPGPGAGNHTITEPFVWDLFPKKGNTLSLIKDTHILEQWFSKCGSQPAASSPPGSF